MLEDDNFVEASVYLTQPGDGLDTAVCCQTDCDSRSPHQLQPPLSHADVINIITQTHHLMSNVTHLSESLCFMFHLVAYH